MFKCWHPKDRARDGIAAVMVHLSFCLLSGILQIRCEMMFTFAGCGMQYSICSDRLKKEKKYYIMVLTISGEGKVAMKKFLGRFFLLFMMILLIGGCARQKETENVMKKSDNQEKVMRYVNYSRFSGDGMDSDFLVPNARYVPENGLGILKTYTENYQDLPCTKYGNQKLAEEKLGEALKKMNISGAEDVNIRLLVNDDPWSIQEGTEIKRQWEKKLGISVELETATGDAFWAEKDNGTVTLTGVIAEYADMMAYLQSWNYDYTYGEEGNQSDTVQKCLRDAERQTDEQIRLSTLYKAEKALMEDVPMIPLQLRKESLLLNRNLTGFETSMNLAGGGYEFLYADFK